MENVTRRWTVCAALLVVAIATSCADNQPAAPGVKGVSMRPNNLVLSVLISPTSSVPPHTSCTWTANVSGGTSPFHYAWAVNNSPIGSDSQFLTYTTGTSGFRIQVTVTDATSAQSSDSKIITIASGAHC